MWLTLMSYMASYIARKETNAFANRHDSRPQRTAIVVNATGLLLSSIWRDSLAPSTTLWIFVEIFPPKQQLKSAKVIYDWYISHILLLSTHLWLLITRQITYDEYPPHKRPTTKSTWAVPWGIILYYNLLAQAQSMASIHAKPKNNRSSIAQSQSFVSHKKRISGQIFWKKHQQY